MKKLEKGESYAKLTEKEKRDKEIEEREQALAEKEKEFKLRELKSDVESDLKEKVYLLHLQSHLFI